MKYPLQLTYGNRHILGAIMLLALALRFGLLFYVLQFGPPRFKTNDSGSYLYPAEALVHYGRFSQDVRHSDAPEVLRTPGYSLFLALVFYLTGDMGIIAIVIQNLLWVVTVLPFTWSMGRILWNERAGNWAALLLAIDPCSILLGQLILTETLFTIVFTAALYVSVKYIRTKRLGYAAAMGFLLSAATLVRPIALYFVIIPLIVIALAGNQRLWQRPRLLTFYALSWFLIGWLPLVAGWCWRNYVLIGRADLGPITDISLLYNRAAGVIALSKGKTSVEDYRQVRDEFKDKYPFYTSMKPDQRAFAYRLAPQYRAIALDILRQHPRQVLQMQLICMKRFFTDANGGLFKNLLRGERHSTPVRRMAKIYIAVIYGMVLLGLWTKLRNRQWNWSDFLLCASVAYYAFISATPEVNARFRVPVMPILTLYGGLGSAMLSNRFFKSQS